MKPGGSDRTRTRGIVSTLLVLALGPGGAGGQVPSVDTTTLATGPASRMVTLFEKTIFKVDVLTLEVRFGEPVAAQLRHLVRDRQLHQALADSVAAVAIDARDVWARMTFRRNVKLNQFLDGLEKNARRARDANVINRTTYEMIVRESPRWYAALDGRNIRDGDEMIYRIRGDTLRTVVRGAEGTVLVDQTDIGEPHVLSVLGGYFAPRSDFRDGLLESLFPS